MQVEVTAFVEDYDLAHYVSNSEQAILLNNIFNECCEDSKRRFIAFLNNDYLIKELKLRGYTITKNEK